MKNMNIKIITSLTLMGLFLCGCADVENKATQCMDGHTYGFWGGLWHGIIAPFSWIGSLFSDDIAIWAVNNNGGWYTFGFMLGIGALSGGSSRIKVKIK